ncbi:MAG: trimeric intracellular cation channel family protein [Prevotella sp.]|nr:trimeric intracellular cation channel family protein [Prevotella sp.]
MISVQQVIEFLGTFAFAISGLRHAAAKRFDWFGGYVCGVAVAIGGGTIRDLMLGTTPFWMTNPFYLICTTMALAFVVLFSKHMKRLDNAWFVFDTLGLALFTIAGLQKSLDFGQPFWVAIIMGCITGAAGGVIRDILLNNEPVIFRHDIYAMASIMGGLVYWLLINIHTGYQIPVIVSFITTCAIRFVSVRYHLQLPLLKEIKNEE